MSKELGIYEILDLSGGLNNTNHGTLIKDSEATSLSNVFVNQKGGIEKRYGSYLGTNDPFAGSATRIFGFRSNTAGLTADKVLATDNSDIKLRTGGATTGTWDYIGWATGTATFTQASATVSRATGTIDWRTQIKANDLIKGPNGTWYTVQAVGAADSLTISIVYPAVTATGAVAVRQLLKSASGPPDAVMFKDKLYIGPALAPTTGTSGLMTYDGTATSRLTDSTELTILVRHKNYIFGCNNKSTTNPSRVYWCALLDPDTWPASNYADVSPNDGDIVRGLVSFNDVLYIFKDTGVWYLAGETFDPSNPTYALKKIINPSNIGTFHGRTIKPFMGKLIFLGQDGIYALESVNIIRNISRGKIDTTIRAVENRATPGDGSTYSYACAEVFDNKYWLGVCTSSSYAYNNQTIVLDDNGAFTLHTIAPSDFALIRTTGNPGVWLTQASGSNGDIYTFDGTALKNDGATAITSNWWGRYITFGDFTKTTHVYDVYVAYENAANQAASVLVYDDSGQVGSTSAHTFPGGTTQFFTVQKFSIERDVNHIYVRIYDDTVDKSFRVLGIIITYEKQSRGSAKVVT